MKYLRDEILRGEINAPLEETQTPRWVLGLLYGNSRRRPRSEVRFKIPEHRLCAAVLLQACEDLYLVAPHALTAAQARLWFASKDTSEFSFLWCCEALDLNPKTVRRVVPTKTPGFFALAKMQIMRG